MPFSAYKNLNAVIKEFNLQYVDDNYILEIEFPINDYFKTDWDFTIERGVVDNSEAAKGKHSKMLLRRRVELSGFQNKSSKITKN